MDNTSSISVNNLNKENPLNIPPVPTDTTNYTGITNGIYNNLANDYQTYKQQADLASAYSGSTNTMIEQALRDAAGIPQQQTNIENQSDIAQKQKDTQIALNEVNRLATEANIIPLKTQQESIGRGRTEAGVAPLQTADLRNNAIQALSANAVYQARLGDLTVAQNQINHAIDLKYKQSELNLATLKQQYENNKDVFDKIDKKRSESLSLLINERTRQLSEQKDNDKQLQDLILQASSQGAPQAILTKVQNARTPSEAAIILGPFAGDYWGTKYKIAQIDKLKAEADESRAKIAAAGGVGSQSQANPQDQAKFLLNTIIEANNLADASGRSKARRGFESYAIGATDYTNLETKIRTLKTNLLTLATDPNIKKFFGPQMTEADVRNMQAAATTLDTESQTPSELRDELKRAQNIFAKFAPGYNPPVAVKQTAPTWAESIKNALLNPQGGNYGYQDNTQ